MDADIYNLQTLFQEQVSFRIPQFQRPYAWGKGRQWAPLWADICNVAERCLNRRVDAEILPHFLGAIVLQFQNKDIWRSNEKNSSGRTATTHYPAATH